MRTSTSPPQAARLPLQHPSDHFLQRKNCHCQLPQDRYFKFRRHALAPVGGIHGYPSRNGGTSGHSQLPCMDGHSWMPSMEASHEWPSADAIPVLQFMESINGWRPMDASHTWPSADAIPGWSFMNVVHGRRSMDASHELSSNLFTSPRGLPLPPPTKAPKPFGYY